MEQGSPAESKGSNSWIYTTIKVLLEIAFIIAIFYAGFLYGDLMINNECPSLDVVKKCYVNTNLGVMSIDDYNSFNDDIGSFNITLEIYENGSGGINVPN